MFNFTFILVAWRSLTHDKGRLLLRLAGVAFAVFLMFVELGFWNALLDASVQLIDQFDGDLIVSNPMRYALNVNENFPARHLAQACAVPEVEDAYPVYLEYVTSVWKNTDLAEAERGSGQPIRVIAFNPHQPVLKNKEVNEQQADLKILYNILLDRKSKASDYGVIKKGIDRELSQHKVHVVGTFELGTDFTTNGNVIMSDSTFAVLFPDEQGRVNPLRWADVGVVRLKPGSDVEAVRAAVEKVLPRDVQVFTKDKFRDRERTYWQTSTPIGFIFLFGLIMGVIVGGVICYQIVSTDVSEQLPEYATLKAIGYHDLYLSGIVVCEALWLAWLGFVPGLGFSWLLYHVMEWWIGLPMRMSSLSILLILGLTTLMCGASGLLVLRKVETADPAEVFG
jgi:putative ABC transport system permease protein